MPNAKPPTKQTLAKYGLTEGDWLAHYALQGFACGVCGADRDRLVVDHEHVRGWKAMPDEERKQYVRGLVCWTCNTQYLGRGITIAKAEGVVDFLTRYEARRPPR